MSVCLPKIVKVRVTCKFCNPIFERWIIIPEWIDSTPFVNLDSQMKSTQIWSDVAHHKYSL